MQSHTNQEKLAALSKTYLKAKDIMVLHDCGSVRATKYRSEFRAWMKEHGIKLVYENDVPTDLYIKFSNYPVKRVMQLARLGL